MKKLSLYTLFFLMFVFQQNTYSGSIKNFSAFYDKDFNFSKELKVDDPTNKIIIVFNPGQRYADVKSRKCDKHSTPVNLISMAGDKIDGKEIIVYNFCTGKLAGDSSKNFWSNKWHPPYKGKTKLEKRVDANLKLIKQFVELGVPHKQIIITGHSCGGLVTLLLASQYLEKFGGGIAMNHACYGRLSEKKKNYDKVYQDLPSVAWQRDKEISIISQSKSMPILIFTHPLDKWDGSYSDWVEKIPGIKRIIISENYTIKGRNCKKGGHVAYKYHRIATAACFQEYNSTIKEYIASRIK